jgi:hypothetical protein
MKYCAEYTIKIKLDNITMRNEHTSKDVEDKVIMLGRQNLKKYFDNLLVDPDKKVVCEEITFETKKDDEEV